MEISEISLESIMAETAPSAQRTMSRALTMAIHYCDTFRMLNNSDTQGVGFPYQAILVGLGVPQFNSILTLTTQSEHKPHR